MDWGRIGYSFFMVLATVVAGVLYRVTRKNDGLATHEKFGIAVGGFCGATLAAKLPFVIDAGAHATVLGAWLSDGKTVLWGLAGGYVGVEVAKWALYIREKTGDRFVIPVACAIAVGRIGCLCNGCCYGVPTDQSWGYPLADGTGQIILRHPAPFYETIFHASAAVVAWYGIRRNWLPSCWMLVYLIGYAVFRFISEWWREEPIVLLGLTFYQWSALAIGSTFAGLLTARIGRSNKSQPLDLRNP